MVTRSTVGNPLALNKLSQTFKQSESLCKVLFLFTRKQTCMNNLLNNTKHYAKLQTACSQLTLLTTATVVLHSYSSETKKETVLIYLQCH